jgi:Metallopeptidase toxin 3
MFLDHDDAKRYPKCKGLMMKLEGTLKHQPQVLKAFLDICKAADQPLPDKDVEKIAREKALRYGVGPRVKLRDGLFKAASGGDVVQACGFNNGFDHILHSNLPVYIEITSFWFDAFEFGYEPERAGRRLTITLLHELIHWVRDLTNASDEVRVSSSILASGELVRGQTWEPGFLFEQTAYGIKNNCNEDEIFDAMISFRKRPF